MHRFNTFFILFSPASCLPRRSTFHTLFALRLARSLRVTQVTSSNLHLDHLVEPILRIFPSFNGLYQGAIIQLILYYGFSIYQTPLASAHPMESSTQLLAPVTSLDDADLHYLDRRKFVHHMGGDRYCIIDICSTKPDLPTLMDTLDLQGKMTVDMEVALDTSFTKFFHDHG